MDGLHTKEMGEILRRIRKEKGLRLEDIADQNISPATVSNIERGVPHVLPGKVQYLLERLGTNESEIIRLRSGIREKLNKIELDMLAIESFCDIGEIDEAMYKLNKYENLDNEHPLAGVAVYLKGKCLIAKGAWKSARRALNTSIKLSAKYPAENIESCSYCLLGVIAYFTNELEEAISVTDKGIKAFVNEGKRSQVLDVLIVNKITFLDKLNRLGEAMALTEEIWCKKEEIKKPDTLLHLYQLKVNILRKMDHHSLAIEIGMEGLNRAGMTTEYRRILELWDAIGAVYLKMNELDNAEVALEFAMKIEKRVRKRNYIYISTLTKYGIMKMRKGEVKKSEQILSEAISLGEKLQAEVFLLDALIYMGDIKILLDKHTEAINYFKRALQLSKNQKIKHKQEYVLSRMMHFPDHLNSLEHQEYLSDLHELQQININVY
ncbi:helix-turn-helix transcriptional regulator [Mechercharimyces sp. CAU 1602]|uniref:helix-turn-helix transcriptional regulator n=1 Tax=Mechercharimyces sp. CAU 1602 TaxID=2973933 RepID=UPI002163452D|nr:helix-turn-helix transcriptional regulator [Mechercharimyces sp. CAU 1602]MCS1351217.1 helix-turn-helix transcriptional regulator [Mechercharimyces sp. CAU 1602]